MKNKKISGPVKLKKMGDAIDVTEIYEKKMKELVELWLKKHPAELDMVRRFYKNCSRREAAEMCAHSLLNEHPESWIPNY